MPATLLDQRTARVKRAMVDALRGIGPAVLKRDIAELEGDLRRQKILSNQVFELLGRLQSQSVKDALSAPLGEQYKSGFGVETALDRRKLNALADAVITPLGDALAGVKSPLPYIAPKLDPLGKEKLLEIVMSGEARGLTWQQLAGEITKGLPQTARMVQDLKSAALVMEFDSGYKMPAEAYANMLARTTSVWASNKGVLDRCEEDGIDLVIVPVSAGSVDFCLELEGKAYALSDAAAAKWGVPLLASCPNGGPPFHPNCRHTIAPYSPSKSQIGKLPVADDAMLTREKSSPASAAQKAFTEQLKVDPRRYAKQIAESASRRGFNNQEIRLKSGVYRSFLGKDIPGLPPGQKEQFKKTALSEDAHLAKRIFEGKVGTRAEYRQKIADTLRNAARNDTFYHKGKDLWYYDDSSKWVVGVETRTMNVVTAHELDTTLRDFIVRRKIENE